jgi:RNA polymerase sigma-70 factor (ECF subfamily)
MTATDQMTHLLSAVAAQRDKAAFTKLFDHFAPRLNAFLCRRGLEPSSAEEVTQHVMEIVWRKALLFDSRKASAATWVFRIARNCRVDLARRNREERLEPDDALSIRDLADLSDVSIDAAQRKERVRAALGNLPQEQKEMVRLAFFEELTHSQIADRTGLPLGTVKSRMRLAFCRLRRELDDRDLSKDP